MDINEYKYIIIMAVFIITILLVVAYNLKRHAESDKWILRFMMCIILSTIAATIVDCAARMLNGQGGAHVNNILMLLNSVLYLLIPLPSLFWYLMIIYLREGNDTFKPLRITSILLLYTIIATLIALNPTNHQTFFIDQNNLYQRGPLFFVPPIFPFVFFGFSILQIYLQKSKYALDVMAAKYFWITPIIGVSIQLLFNTMNLYLPSITVSVILMYIGFSAKSIRLDYLTGIHNRHFLENVLKAKVQDKKFSAIMIDINNFKAINDKYGHTVGDSVLIDVASILKSAIKKNSFTARYGGDEFMVILDTTDEATLEAAAERIKKLIFNFNQTSAYPFVISVSLGYDVYRSKLFKTKSAYIKNIDRKMYLHKQQKPKQLVMKENAFNITF